MKNDWLEQNLEDRLGNKSSEFDMDAMWNEIQDKRTPKKDRRAIWIPFLLLGFFVVAGLGYYTLRNADTSVINASVTNTDLKSSEISKLPTENINPVNTNVESAIEAQIENQITTLEYNNSNNLPLTKNNSNENSSNNRKQIIEQTPIAQSTSVSSYTNTSAALATNNNDDIDNNSASSINKNHVKLSKPESIQTQKTESRSPIASSLVPILLSHVQYSEYLRYDELNMRKAAFSSLENKLPAKANAKLITGLQFGLEFTFGVSQRELSNTNQKFENWIMVRRQNEKMLDQFSGAGFVRINLKNQFYVHTGLEYQQYTAKLTTDAYEFSSEIVRDTIEILVDAEGMVLSATEGDILIQSSIMTRYTRFQKYRSLGVPLLLGKNIKLSEKGQLSLNAGAVFSYTSMNSGKIQSSALAPDQFISIVDAGYGSKLLMQANLGMEYHHLVGKNAQIFAGMNLKQDLNSRINGNKAESLGITDKFNSYNLKLGWIKSF